MREYDIIAIGGGSGGIATMNRAGEHGAKMCIRDSIHTVGFFDFHNFYYTKKSIILLH